MEVDTTSTDDQVTSLKAKSSEVLGNDIFFVFSGPWYNCLHNKSLQFMWHGRSCDKWREVKLKVVQYQSLLCQVTHQIWSGL